ncbi:MAG: hypothetical protein RSC82_07235 [Oscillospiraceae bacterium]
MSRLYRQTTLNHLYSTEQLDRTVSITPPRLWLALIGALLICAAALLWSVFGRLPVVVQGSGVYLSQGDDTVFVLYVPMSEGKKIQAGMEVQLSPSTISPQEYGHIKGTVRSVDAYVAEQAQMRTQLGSDALVNAFSQDGPVVTVLCEALPDPNAQSGLLWSNRKGASVTLSDCTLVSASIIIEEKVPITLLMPHLREFFSPVGSKGAAG